MKIPAFVQTLKSSILSSTSFQLGKTLWVVVRAVVGQSRRKASMVSQGDGKFGPKTDHKNISKRRKHNATKIKMPTNDAL